MGKYRVFRFMESRPISLMHVPYDRTALQERRDGVLGLSRTFADRNGLVDDLVLGAVVRLQSAFGRACERTFTAFQKPAGFTVQGLRVLGIG